MLNFLPDGRPNPDRKKGPRGRALMAVAPSFLGSTDPNSSPSSSDDEGVRAVIAAARVAAAAVAVPGQLFVGSTQIHSSGGGGNGGSH